MNLLLRIMLFLVFWFYLILTYCSSWYCLRWSDRKNELKQHWLAEIDLSFIEEVSSLGKSFKNSTLNLYKKSVFSFAFFQTFFVPLKTGLCLCFCYLRHNLSHILVYFSLLPQEADNGNIWPKTVINHTIECVL